MKNNVMLTFLMTIMMVMLALQTKANKVDNISILKPKEIQLKNSNPKRVLFIGNSYLYYNDSLHNHVRRMVKENYPTDARRYQYKSATIGGSSLSHHNIDSYLEPGKLDIDEPFDLVILQGGSDEVLSKKRRTQFLKNVERFNQKIKMVGAETALYMIHAYVEPHEKTSPEMIDKIKQAYVSTGNEISALVIPVGLAYEKAYQLKPNIRLHKNFDGSHPNLLGTYLAACVVLASVYKTSPIGINYDYFGAVNSDDALFLQNIANETVREFYKR